MNISTFTSRNFMNSSLPGVLYFVLAGIINFVATFLFAKIHTLDWLILAICVLPALFRKKLFLTAYGLTFGLLSSLALFLGLIYVLDSTHHTSFSEFFGGFLLMASTLIASINLIIKSRMGQLRYRAINAGS